MSHPDTRFLTRAFAKAVKAKRTAEGLTLTQAGEAAGVNRVTIFRIEDGQSVFVGNVLSVCKWLGVDPFAFHCPDVPRESNETGRAA